MYAILHTNVSLSTIKLNPMTLGNRLKNERKRLGKTQAAFAKLAGVALPTLQNYESGLRNPDSQFLANISNVGADIQLVVTGTPSESGIAPDERVLLDGYRVLSFDERRAAIAYVLSGIKEAAPINGTIIGTQKNHKSKVFNGTSVLPTRA